jgi:hypothetical protein
MNESGNEPIQTGDKKYTSSDQGNNPKNTVDPSEVLSETLPPSELEHSVGYTHDTHREGHHTAPHPPNWCEKWTLWLEVAGVLGLAFYCWVNWKEWRTFDSERQTMETEFKASQTNAFNQLAEMRRQREVDERAWLAPSPVNPLTLNYSDPSRIFYALRTRNCGKTPAKNVRTVVNWTTNANSFTMPDIKPNISPQFIPLDGESVIETPIIPYNIYTAAKSGNLPLFIYGTVWYDDIFGVEHWTQFCWSLDINRNLTYEGPNHNDCDTNN